MFQFLGLDFLSGENALAGSIAGVDNIQTTQISNAIFNHVNITQDTEQFTDSTPPLDWTPSTILNANLNNNINAGNIDYLLNQISALKIKRRVKGEFDWITLKTIKVNRIVDLQFAFEDYLNEYNVEYEYALVPVLEEVEGYYNIDSILSKFSGVFIGSAEESYRFLYDVSYGSNARNQQTGVFSPLGRQYPIIVANGNLSYESGSVTATLLNDDFGETGVIDKEAITAKKNALKKFLTDKRPKVLKDFNQNSWLVMITDNVQVSYLNGSAMGIPQVTFNWVEIGDINNKQDLIDSGFIEEGA